MKNKVKQLRDWYERYERRLSSLSLLFGFVFDSLTISRVDALRDNLWIALNLMVAVTCLILLNKKTSRNPKKHFWLYTVLQFSFGSILGAFFIFYFQSATLAVSWPFLLILLLAMIGNEVFKQHYERQIFQLSFLYLALFVFSIFIVPILLHKIGIAIFFLSGVVSLVLIYLFMSLTKQIFWAPVLVIFIFVNALYFLNLIPPIPLSLKDAGIYHGIVKNTDGSYRLIEEETYGFWKYFHLQQKVHVVQGQPLYAYSAIYSPASLDTNIVHEWQYFDETEDKWMTRARIPLRLSGGRVEGFRTFSNKATLAPGLWRVNVSTPGGQVIGRIKFKIIFTESAPPLVTYTK